MYLERSKACTQPAATSDFYGSKSQVSSLLWLLLPGDAKDTVEESSVEDSDVPSSLKLLGATDFLLVGTLLDLVLESC
ncbi:MAG: hypothetical protein CL912_14945 [Deltaproteobacteria bacterium]|nr:hypothetical protein [Deltaproteobacteria bacterium]